MPDKPTIPNYPPQGIQAQLDLLYLYNPDAANQLVEQLEAGLCKLEDFQAQIEKALEGLQGVMRYKGSVATEADLPTEGNVNGDVWNIQDTDENVAWDGEKWDKFGSAIDTSLFLKTTGGILRGPLQAATADGIIFMDLSGKPIIRFNGVYVGVHSNLRPVYAGLSLGSRPSPWGTIFARGLNNGEEIGIPKKGGTLALLEDIPQEHAMVTDQSLSGSGTTESPLGLSQTIHNEIDSLATRMPALPTDTGTYALKCINGFPQWEYEGGAE